MKQQYLQVILLSFLLGVFVNNIFIQEVLSIILLFLALLICCLVILYFRQYRHLLLSLLIGISLGILCSSITLSKIQKNTVFTAGYLHSEHHLSVSIIDIQKRNSDYTEFKARVDKIGNTQVPPHIYTLIRIPANFSLLVGDSISYRSKLYPIEDFNRFEYRNYMLSQSIYFRTYGNTFQKISENNTLFIITELFYFRKFLLEQLEKLYPHEERIFLGGILLGAREDIPEELKQDFNNSGLTHFIAVSGFNITILVIFFGFLFQYLPVFLRTILVISCISLFTCLVGFSAPVVRAAIMGVLGYIILVSGRQSHSTVLILITATCMTFLSPLTLNYDVSFHLSFFAVIGIIYTQGFFKKMFSFLPEFLAIREAFVLTLSALVFTLPIMAFQFGQVSLFAPFANIAVTWTIPIAMLFGFLSLVLYLVFPIVGYGTAFLTWLFLKFDIMMVHFFGNLDFALLQIDFGEYSPYIQAGYFLLLITVILLYDKK